VEFAALKWWHWMLIALIVGMAMGLLRDNTQNEIHGNYIEGFGYFLGSQKLFEEALIDQVDGKRRFSGVTVYFRRIDDRHGQRKPVYLVKGMYYASPPQVVEGRQQGGWQPVCFIAPVPYDPMIDLGSLDKPGGPDWGKAFRAAGLHPTVLDFLSVMHAAAGVDYRFAWWDQYPLLTSVLASVLVIGICWPPVNNLLAFGRITRPLEAKGMSLWKVRNRRRAAAAVVQLPGGGQGDNSPTSAMEPSTPNGKVPSPSAAAPLSGGPLEPSPSPEESRKEFGAGKEDFYPTERHAPTRSEEIG
jgi:hypothetical protein